MDARFGFLWGSDPQTWDFHVLRSLVIGRGVVTLYHLPRRYQAAAGMLAGRAGLRIRRTADHWEVTL